MVTVCPRRSRRDCGNREAGKAGIGNPDRMAGGQWHLGPQESPRTTKNLR